jgi:hypothetical protein
VSFIKGLWRYIMLLSISASKASDPSFSTAKVSLGVRQ